MNRRNHYFYSTWQSKTWETGKPGRSISNKNSFSRWIIGKSDGLTTIGLQNISELVRDYAYLILTIQTVKRGQIQWRIQTGSQGFWKPVKISKFKQKWTKISFLPGFSDSEPGQHILSGSATEIVGYTA